MRIGFIQVRKLGWYWLYPSGKDIIVCLSGRSETNLVWQAVHRSGLFLLWRHRLVILKSPSIRAYGCDDDDDEKKRIEVNGSPVPLSFTVSTLKWQYSIVLQTCLVIFLYSIFFFFCCRYTKPQTFADCIGNELPLGWEEAYDPQIGVYYINHVNRKYHSLT